MAMLGFTEREAWKKTPYQIITLFEYHKEYNPHIFGGWQQDTDTGKEKENGIEIDDIDIALGGL